MKSTSFVMLLGLAVVPAGAAVGDHVCRADVAYQWKRGKEETAGAVQFTRIESRGKDEAEAKAKLGEAASREKLRAVEECRREHENQAGCVARKFDLYGVSLTTLSFSGRKKIEEAIQNDCTAAQGVCTEATSSEPQCAALVDPAAEAAAAKDKKDGKGKKK